MTETLTIELVLAVIAAAGVVYGWIAKRQNRDDEITDRLVRLETKMDMLTADVEKHNTIVERTYKTEADLKTAFKRIDEHRERIERMEHIKIGGTE